MGARDDRHERGARAKRSNAGCFSCGGVLVFAGAFVVAIAVYVATADPTESALVWMVRSLAFGERDEEILPADLPVSRLEELLGSNRMEVHTAAANRLKKMGSADPFLHSLRTADAHRRSVAAHWLMFFPEPRVRAALREASTDQDEWVRAWVAFALGRIGEADDVSVLRALQADPIRMVRERADEAIDLWRKRGLEFNSETN